MIEEFFRQSLGAAGANEEVFLQLWHEIRARYSAAGRHYHTLAHLEAMVRELSEVRASLRDWHAIIFSVAYHDIIYDVLKNDNEEQSAAFAVDRLRSVDVPEHHSTKCLEQILATKKHGLSVYGDTNFLIDADLSILGSSPENYRRYTEQIRREYQIYPDDVYTAGRKKVLTHFLSPANIYKTSHFRKKYEELAIKNIENELSRLHA